MLHLLESAAAPPCVSPAAVLSSLEHILLRCCAGATRVEALLVNRWFNKLFRFTATAREGKRLRPSSVVSFDMEPVCNIGEGIAGKAALTGKTQVVQLPSRGPRQQQHSDTSSSVPERSAFSSVVCWPVLDHTGSSMMVGGQENDPANGTCEEGLRHMATNSTSLDDIQEDASREGGLVLAVLQVHSAAGELAAVAMNVLRDIGRLLVPILKTALARRQEEVLRCEAEALWSLSCIEPKEVGLMEMVEQILHAAEHVSGAERVGLFFVDEAANELWVAKSLDLDDARVKIGQGLCGYAAQTGEMVNVINSYEDSRFDSSWDERTGFLTKR